MNESRSAFEMGLVFHVPSYVSETALLIADLDSAGFRDALFGTVFENRLGVQHVRSGDSAEKVVADTTCAVLSALPPGTTQGLEAVSERAFGDLPADQQLQIMQLCHF